MNMGLNKGRVEFECDNLLLERGFYWAKAMALSYAHEGDAVGDWYEASLPGRNAFCMRDTAHYSLGAQVLGLTSHNKNMFRKFAQNISETRDYCSYWEITKDDQPLRGDYTNDSDFWYNLPANFDVLQACWKMFRWTNDHDYLHLPDLNAFYNATVSDYIQTWDRNGDGIPDRAVPGCRRGIPSYEERDEYADALVMNDLIALQAQAFDAYARIHRMKGNDYLFSEYTGKASELRKYYDRTWWDEKSRQFYTVMLENGVFASPSGSSQDLGILPLYYGLITDKFKLQLQLEQIRECGSDFVEYLSYLPEVFYRYGMDEDAYRYILKLTDPKLERREYPEISFAVVGAVATGIIGVEPHADEMRVRTESRLPKALKTAWMRNSPVFGGEISVGQIGGTATGFVNHTGDLVVWQPVFRADVPEIVIDGKKIAAAHGKDRNGNAYSYVDVRLENGHRSKAEADEMG